MSVTVTAANPCAANTRPIACPSAKRSCATRILSLACASLTPRYLPRAQQRIEVDDEHHVFTCLTVFCGRRLTRPAHLRRRPTIGPDQRLATPFRAVAVSMGPRHPAEDVAVGAAIELGPQHRRRRAQTAGRHPQLADHPVDLEPGDPAGHADDDQLVEVVDGRIDRHPEAAPQVDHRDHHAAQLDHALHDLRRIRHRSDRVRAGLDDLLDPHDLDAVEARADVEAGDLEVLLAGSAAAVASVADVGHARPSS
ncbi:hypothetical protein OV079_12840 [Nannocystis pusilla]|uniref:Uncharacterized protein n=1 Tax=Nannocystis pusilla TaxID=889268 RepID=A0A9X3IWH1_9BACT|nr:hypothetical protein [Nannocystis pusilla]MCY1006431.1 hypothetical protein [Nannocystis pusilla]